MERTLVIIKPEAVASKLVGRIISIYEYNHLEVIHAHKTVATREVLEQHYSDHAQKPYFEELLAYMSSSAIVLLVIEGEDAVERVRELHGATNPANANPGTIRYMFGTALQENAVHGSSNLEIAKKEIEIWRDLMKYED